MCFAIPELPAYFWRALSLICGKQISFLQGRSFEDGRALWINGVYVCSTIFPLHWACLLKGALQHVLLTEQLEAHASQATFAYHSVANTPS